MAGRAARGRDAPARLVQADETFRSDIEAADLARFVTMVLNGLALRVVAGDPTEIEPMLRLVDGALALRQ